MSFQEFFENRDENRKNLGKTMRRIDKFTISIKLINSYNGMYVFSQANENFSSTLDRIEDMAKTKKQDFVLVTLKNTGMRLTVYE